ILRDGIQVPIVGPPNAGKSSLFNAILAEERAIVTEIPGTTRDTIAEKIELDGIIVRFIDTAGMRETDDRIESIGVERARREIAGAQIVIAVFDAAKTSIAAIREFLDGYAGKQIALVLNKIDLLTEAQIANLDAEFQAAFPSLVSARNLVGIDELLARISRYIANTMQPLGTDNNLLTNPRHQRCILSAVAALGAVRAKLAADESFELLAFDLRLAVEALEEILGRITNEDLLAEIFSRFCIGK
ncbi:MAG: GTP-binding protein, partial [candidate division Zixibacteria bacterium]|nr:GTP-binding protein [candidate division Zixibacteria bacterium]